MSGFGTLVSLGACVSCGFREPVVWKLQGNPVRSIVERSTRDHCSTTREGAAIPPSPEGDGGIAACGMSTGGDWSTWWLFAVLGDTPQSRLVAGRSYWQGNLIKDLHIEEGRITATVNEAAHMGHQVMIEVGPVVAPAVWGPLLERLALTRETLKDATLDQRWVRQEIERDPGAGRSALFTGDAQFTCSCSERAQPCTHAVGVAYAFWSDTFKHPVNILNLYWQAQVHAEVTDTELILDSVQNVWIGRPVVPERTALRDDLPTSDLPRRVNPPVEWKSTGEEIHTAMDTILAVVRDSLNRDVFSRRALERVRPIVIGWDDAGGDALDPSAVVRHAEEGRD